MFFVSEAKRSGRGREDRVSKQDSEYIDLKNLADLL